MYYHLFQARDGNPQKKELVLPFTDTPPHKRRPVLDERSRRNLELEATIVGKYVAVANRLKLVTLF